MRLHVYRDSLPPLSPTFPFTTDQKKTFQPTVCRKLCLLSRTMCLYGYIVHVYLAYTCTWNILTASFLVGTSLTFSITHFTASMARKQPLLRPG